MLERIEQLRRDSGSTSRELVERDRSRSRDVQRLGVARSGNRGDLVDRRATRLSADPPARSRARIVTGGVRSTSRARSRRRARRARPYARDARPQATSGYTEDRTRVARSAFCGPVGSAHSGESDTAAPNASADADQRPDVAGIGDLPQREHVSRVPLGRSVAPDRRRSHVVGAAGVDTPPSSSGSDVLTRDSSSTGSMPAASSASRDPRPRPRRARLLARFFRCRAPDEPELRVVLRADHAPPAERTSGGTASAL